MLGWHAKCSFFVQEALMADSSSSSGIVAIVAIVLLVLIGGFVAYQMGGFGDGHRDGMGRMININVKK